MYYIGYYDDKIITLDPHTEQDAVTEIDDETIDSFITKYPKMIDFDESDTSLAFWFYLKDKTEASIFYDTIEEWKLENPDNYIIGINDVRKEMDIDLDAPAQFEDDFEII